MKITATHIIAGIVVLLLGGAVVASVLVQEGTTEPVPAPEPQPLPPEEMLREGRTGGGCAVGGCSAQVCADAATAPEIITTCEYRPEYACYQSARCERQANGECGWTETAELTACLRNSES